MLTNRLFRFDSGLAGLYHSSIFEPIDSSFEKALEMVRRFIELQVISSQIASRKAASTFFTSPMTKLSGAAAVKRSEQTLEEAKLRSFSVVHVNEENKRDTESRKKGWVQWPGVYLLCNYCSQSWMMTRAMTHCVITGFITYNPQPFKVSKESLHYFMARFLCIWMYISQTTAIFNTARQKNPLPLTRTSLEHSRTHEH